MPSWQILRSFEGSPEGYTASGGHELEVTDTDSVHGAYAMVAAARFPGSLKVSKKSGIGQIGRIEIAVKCQPAAPSDLCVLMYAQDKDGLWWQSEHQPVRAGSETGWQFIRFDLHRDFYPVNHGAPFDRRFAGQVASVGFRFFSRQPWEGRILLDRLRGMRAAAEPLAIRNARVTESVRRFQTALKQDVTEFSPPTGKVGQAPPYGSVKAPLYRPYELEFDVAGGYFNPFDADEIQVDGVVLTPAGRELRMPCFFYQPYERIERPEGQDLLVPRGKGAWRLRYAPLEAGVHRVRLTAATGGQGKRETTTSGELVFEAVATGGGLAPIRVSQQNRFAFETSEGEPFYPIGHNVRSPTDTRCTQVLGWSPLPDRGLAAFEHFLPLIAANRENLVEVWMASWWLGIEWTSAWKGYHGLGRYNLEHAWMLDELLELAYKNRLYVHLVIDNHGKISSFCDAEWQFSPYNRSQGGFLYSPDHFFTDERARKLHRQKLRYILARWAAYTNIMGFELISELDLTGSRHGTYRQPYILEWHREMTEYVRSLDACRRPITTHFSGDFNVVDAKLVADPCIDYVTVDAYRGGVGPFAPFMFASSQALARFGKPFMITEYGGAWNGTDEAGLRADLHAGLWAAACTRTAGTPLLWWFDFIDRRDLYGEYAALSRFLEAEDVRRTGDWQEEQRYLPDGLAAMFFYGATEGRGWLYDRRDMTYLFPESRRRHAGLEIRLPADGRCAVEFWDTGSGCIIKTLTVEDGRVAVPEFAGDIALKWRITGQPSPMDRGTGVPPATDGQDGRATRSAR